MSVCGHVMYVCGHVMYVCGHVMHVCGHVMYVCGCVMSVCGHVMSVCKHTRRVWGHRYGGFFILCWTPGAMINTGKVMLYLNFEALPCFSPHKTGVAMVIPAVPVPPALILHFKVLLLCILYSG